MTVKEMWRNGRRFIIGGWPTCPIVFLMSMILLVAQWGCASAPKASPSLLSEEDRAKLGTIGVVSARFSPELDLESRISGKISAAAMGFFGCILGCGYGAFLAPFVGIYMAIAAESSEKVQAAAATLNQGVADLNIQGSMRDLVLQVGRNKRRRAFVSFEDVGPTILNEEVSYSFLADKGVNTILEISVAKIGFLSGGIEPSLVIGVCSRLLTSADGTELYAHPWVYRSDPRRFVAWAADGAQPLRDELDRGLQALAEQIVENLFVPVPTSVYVERKEVPALRDRESWCGIRYKPIQDFKSITGTWSGRIEFAPASEGPSTMTVTMTIKDDGSYEMVAPKQHAGILRLERGKIQLTVDIDLTIQRVTLTLHNRGERQSLEGWGHDGATLWEMTRVQ